MVFHGNGIVWHKDKRLMKFIDGKYETDNKQIIDVLLKAGYPHDEEPEPVESEPPKKPVKRKVGA